MKCEECPIKEKCYLGNKNVEDEPCDLCKHAKKYQYEEPCMYCDDVDCRFEPKEGI